MYQEWRCCPVYNGTGWTLALYILVLPHPWLAACGSTSHFVTRLCFPICKMRVVLQSKYSEEYERVCE